MAEEREELKTAVEITETTATTLLEARRSHDIVVSTSKDIPGWHQACAWLREGFDVKVTFEKKEMTPQHPAEQVPKLKK